MKSLREKIIDFLLRYQINITKKSHTEFDSRVDNDLKSINSNESVEILTEVSNEQIRKVCKYNYHNYEINYFGHCTVCYSKNKIKKLHVHNHLQHC